MRKVRQTRPDDALRRTSATTHMPTSASASHTMTLFASGACHSRIRPLAASWIFAACA